MKHLKKFNENLNEIIDKRIGQLESELETTKEILSWVDPINSRKKFYKDVEILTNVLSEFNNKYGEFIEK